MPSPPTVYQSSGHMSGPDSSSITLSTGSPYNSATDVLVAMVSTRPATPGATFANSNGSALTWHQLSTSQSQSPDGFEIFWANLVGNNDPHTITATALGSSGIGLGVALVRGVFDVTNPFDSNVSLPATGKAAASPLPDLTISTTQADDIIIGMSVGTTKVGGNVAVPYLNGGTYTNEIALNSLSVGGTNLNWYTVTSPQSGLVVPGHSGMASDDGGIEFLIALTANARSNPLQTFVTCVCT